jgi:hypothetical protein
MAVIGIIIGVIALLLGIIAMFMAAEATRIVDGVTKSDITKK